jgi:hypothetical protein
MSPPEVWGPAVWNLFHTLCEKLDENAFQHVAPGLFNLFVRICKFLPCPDCSADAGKFLANIKFSDIKNKTDLKNTFYLFHNRVNAKKRKGLFNYGFINVYANYRIIPVINNFIANYNTKGNMKLLAESFQRQLVIKDFKNWMNYYIKAFIPTFVPAPLLEAKQVENIDIILEEPVVEPVVEPVEEPVVEPVEEPVVPIKVQAEEPVEEPVEEPIVPIEEPVVEPVVEPIVQEEESKEELVEEPNKEEEPVAQEIVKPKRGRKPKKI